MWMQLRSIPEVGLGQQPPRKGRPASRAVSPSATQSGTQQRGRERSDSGGGQIHMPQPLAATVVACLATSTLPLFMRASA